jgi:hypothetical protein
MSQSGHLLKFSPAPSQVRSAPNSGLPASMRGDSYHCRHRKNASTMMTAAPMAKTPSALIVAPQRSMSNLSDMQGSPLKEHESPWGTIYLRVGLLFGQPLRAHLLGTRTRATPLKTFGSVSHWRAKDF